MEKREQQTSLARPRAGRITYRTVLLVSLPLLFELLFASVLFWQLKQAEVEIAAEQHAKDVVYQATRLNDTIFDAAFSMAGYSMTKNALFYKRYNSVAKTIPEQIKSLSEAVANDPPAAQSTGFLKADWEQTTGAVEKAKELIEEAPHLSFNQLSVYADLKATTNTLKRDIAFVTDRYLAIANAAPMAKERNRATITACIVIGLIGSFALTIFLAVAFDADLRKRLKLLIENTARLSRGQELGPPVSGPNDDIAILDADFRRMAVELDEASRKERDIVEFASDVICSINEEGKITRINPACSAMWGYAPDQLLERDYSSLVPENMRSALGKAFRDARTSSETITKETEVTTCTDERSFVRWSIRWSSARNLYYCVIHDITDRKNVEEMKQQFLAMVSHDLRSPLASLRATLELFTEGAFGALSDVAKNRIFKARDTTDWLFNLVTDLLEVERLETGLKLSLSEIPIADVIEHSVDQVRALCDGKGISVKVLTDTFETLHCDTDRLPQVFINLLSNAVKFSDQGSTIEIDAQFSDDYVEFSIADHGRGIPAEKQALIFERFKQVKDSDAKGAGANKGFGLGLPICKMIVEAHGGTIGVRSTEGNGSTFWFRIPTVKAGSTTVLDATA